MNNRNLSCPSIIVLLKSIYKKDKGYKLEIQNNYESSKLLFVLKTHIDVFISCLDRRKT